MFRPGPFLFLTFVFLLLACKHGNTSSYAIKDFRDSLQPHLINTVARGIVIDRDSVLKDMATDKELTQLGQSENPILRAAAFREMLNRPSFNHFDILMHHLDDTAVVAIDQGEFGVWFRKVSDDILLKAEWKTQDEKNKTIEQVLTRHNRLTAAYLILTQIEAQEKYYPFIKDMATRSGIDSDDADRVDFATLEYALYGLAKFRKKSDIAMIRDRMFERVWRLSDVSFRLMEEFPDTAYFAVLSRYHRRQFYKFSGNRPGGFTGFVADRASPESFVEALVAQESEKSARLLDTILNRLPTQTCMPDRRFITDQVITMIWKHPCPAYERLRRKIKADAIKISRNWLTLPGDSSNMPVDTSKIKIRW